MIEDKFNEVLEEYYQEFEDYIEENNIKGYLILYDKLVEDIEYLMSIQEYGKIKKLQELGYKIERQLS